VRRSDNLTTCVCRLSLNLESSASLDPQGLYRPVQGLLYFYCMVGLHASVSYSFGSRPKSFENHCFVRSVYFCNLGDIVVECLYSEIPRFNRISSLT
jgi:uncharacterized membrane protein YhdT